jgi:hypothetical protein
MKKLGHGSDGIVAIASEDSGPAQDGVNPFHYKVMGKEAATSMTMQCDGADHRALGEAYIDENGARTTRAIADQPGPAIRATEAKLRHPRDRSARYRVQYPSVRSTCSIKLLDSLTIVSR